MPTPPRPSLCRPTPRRISAIAVAIGLIVLSGCSDVPTNYNERAEENFMVGCEDGGSKVYCGCVWDKLEKTVPWKDFNKFDKDQQTADEEDRKIKVPSGIQAAFDACIDDGADAAATTAKPRETTTTLG